MNNIKGLELLVNNLGHTESSFREGAEWTLRYLANHADQFTSASKISFEVDEQLKVGRRVVDMVVEYPLRSTVYYEFKSVKNLPPKDFIQQFSKDLTRLNFEMDNLKWVFDGKKITRSDMEKLRKPLLEIIKKKSPNLALDELEETVGSLLDKVFVVN